MLKPFLKTYVSPKGEDGIRNYRYKCKSDSLIYNNLMGPLANFCITVTPVWIAPNAITFFGFLFNIIPHLLILLYAGENLASGVPRWLCLMTGFGQFLYMNFDNMDGKQARRTNSSTALGMLYDHGLDGISGWLIGLNLAAILRLDNNPLFYYAIIVVPLLGFFYTMWEEYHLDFLDFPFINPVDEGVTLINSVMIFSGIVGTEFWLEEGLFGLRNNECFVSFIIFVCLAGMVQNIIKVLAKHKSLHTLNTLAVSVFLMVCAASIQLCSPTNIAERRMRSVITCISLGFSKIIGSIQLAHCAGEEFQQWRKSFVLTNIILAANALAGHFLGTCPIDEDLLLTTMIIVNLIALIHYLLSITEQLTKVLGIKVFSLNKVKA